MRHFSIILIFSIFIHATCSNAQDTSDLPIFMIDLVARNRVFSSQFPMPAQEHLNILHQQDHIQIDKNLLAIRGPIPGIIPLSVGLMSLTAGAVNLGEKNRIKKQHVVQPLIFNSSQTYDDWKNNLNHQSTTFFVIGGGFTLGSTLRSLDKSKQKKDREALILNIESLWESMEITRGNVASQKDVLIRLTAQNIWNSKQFSTYFSIDDQDQVSFLKNLEPRSINLWICDHIKAGLVDSVGILSESDDRESSNARMQQYSKQIPDCMSLYP